MNLKSLAYRTLLLNRPIIARNAAHQMAYLKAAVTEKERRMAVMKDAWDAPNHGGVYYGVLAYLDELSFLQLDGE